MSWWVNLVDKNTGNYLPVARFTEGGTYTLGGETHATLNVTYNYAKFFHDALDREMGLRWLNGKTAGRFYLYREEGAVCGSGKLRRFCLVWVSRWCAPC